jgi:hypothetical protein
MDPIPQNEEPIIGDVNITFKNEIKNRYFKHIVVFVLVYPVLFYFLFPYLIANKGVGPLLALVFLFGSLFFVAMFFGGLREKILVKFYQQFALANGYTFNEPETPFTEKGTLFKEGYSPVKSNIVKGVFQDHPIKLFNYNLTIGQGKSKHTYFYTVFEIDYDKRIPTMFLRVDKHAWQMFTPSFSSKRRLVLEGDFDDFFDLFVEEKFEIEALQIFTPDIMHRLMTDWKKFSLEFIEDSIYIYTLGTIDKKEDLHSMYALAQYLIKKLAPIIGNMESSTIAMQERFSVK